MSRRLLILGSTGSIGTQALDVVARADDLEVVGLSASSSWEQLVAQAQAHGGAAHRARRPGGGRARGRGVGRRGAAGPEGLVELITGSGADLVLNALVGSAGLGPTMATLGEGIDLALANKESLVVGGELVMQLAEATGARDPPGRLRALRAAPADRGRGAGHRRAARPHRLGRPVPRPQRGPSSQDVTVEEALRHPTWEMGGKITIDSATLMNKGLEVIEAHHLFGTPYERIDVVVHPQSIVHALVTLCDGASLAHLGHPDMRVPIAYALHHPERVDVPVRAARPRGGRRADVRAASTSTRSRACGSRARRRIAGGTAPCVLNAANEVAVHAFLGGRLPFLGIAEVIETALERLGRGPCARSSRCTRPTARRASWRRRSWTTGADQAGTGLHSDAVSWLLAFVGFAC